MQTKKLLAVIAAAVSLAGCEAIDALTFRPDQHSGVAGPAKARLTLLRSGDQLPTAALEEDKGLTAAVNEHCTPQVDRVKTTAAAGALIGFAVDVAIKALSDALQAKVDAIKSASVKSYTGILIVEENPTLGAEPRRLYSDCLLLWRTIGDARSEAGEKPGMALLIGIEPKGSKNRRALGAAVLSALYLRVDNAAAITGPGKPIDMSVAISVVSIVPQKDGPVRRELSLGGFDIRDVPLGASKPWNSKNDRPTTGLMALPPSNAVALEIKVAVVETGSALPDTEKAKAQIKAFQDAVGPEIKAGVLKGLSLQ